MDYEQELININYDEVIYHIEMDINYKHMDADDIYDELIEKTGCPACRCIMEHMKEFINEIGGINNDIKIAKMLMELHEDDDL